MQAFIALYGPSMVGILFVQLPMQEVAPSAVSIALAMDTINCVINFAVSFLLIFSSFLFYPFTFLLLIYIGDCPQVEV